MKILIRPEADRDLDGIFSWIVKENPPAARGIIRRIREKLDLLSTTGFAEIGRPGQEEGTRELVVGPYIVVYEIHKDRNEIVVLGVFHGARTR
jgi:toxin ParE1/3/4